jgi:serine protease Do
MSAARCFIPFILLSPLLLSAAEEKAPAALTAETLAQQVRPSLVSIEPAGRDGEVAGIGTGFVLSADGLIATNFHVIGEGRALKVTRPDGTELEVTAIHAWDRSHDLAVIKVKAETLPALSLMDSDRIAQGDRITAMGNPLGLKFSVVEGIVSARQEVDGRDMIQLAMPVERGNSGGPLLDAGGKVAGIVAMKSALTDNIGFAVPANHLRNLLASAAPVPMKNWLTIGALDARVWKPSGGRWTQRAGVIRARDKDAAAFGGRTLCIYQPEPPALPYEVSVRVKLDDESGAAGLVFCSDGGDVHYGFYPSSGGLRLTRFDGPDVSSWNILRQLQHTAYQPGEWNHLRVRIEADKLICYVNGEEVISLPETALRSGRAGLCKFRNTEPDFRDFRLTSEPDKPDPAADAVAAILGSVSKGETLSKEARDTLAAYPDTTREAAGREAALLEKRAAALRREAAQAHENGIAKQLVQVLEARTPDAAIRAAFLVSKLDNPDVDPAVCMAELDRMTASLRAFLTKEDQASPRAILAAMHRWMFHDNGFHGSREDMNHRANSYLDQVMADREGLPVTLCLLHAEFARRLGLDIAPINFQGRVLNRFIIPGDTAETVYIDAWDRGKLLTKEEATILHAEINDIPPMSESWEPIAPADIIIRVLNNLTSNAEAAEDRERMLRYLNTILAIAPEAAQQRLRRLFLHMQARRRGEARADAAWLLENAPAGMDTSRLHELIDTLREE